jgi:hypothetical protein
MHDSQVFIPIVMFICIAVVLWSYINHITKSKKEQQATLQKLIDSGQALSPELITSIAKPKSLSNNKDFSRGVLAIGLAFAIFIYGYFGLVNEEGFTWLSAFPLTIGIAFLFIHKFKPKDL